MVRTAPAGFVVVTLVSFALAAQAQTEPPGAAIAKADKLIDEHRPQSYARAIELLQEARAKSPDDVDLMLKQAQAIVGYLRITTEANLPRADGATADTPEHRKIWQRFAPEAVKLARDVVAARPNDKEAQAALLEAYMYEQASYGILKAVLTNSVNVFRDAAERMTELDPSYEAAMGLSYLSGLYVVAPPPVGDVGKARSFAERAVKQAGDTALPHYLLAVAALKQGDEAVARKQFQWIRDNDCKLETARDYCDVMKREAKRGLELTAGAS